MDNIIHTLCKLLQAKDDLTGTHSQQVAALMCGFASYLGFSAENIYFAYLAGLLHDIGKLGISKSILTKPGTLCAEEFAAVRQHPDIGAHILENIKGLEKIAQAVRHHHERYDGTGYPYELCGEDIPNFSRMLALCDSYDAMTSVRHYRQAYTKAKALNEIGKEQGMQFDPCLARLFISFILKYQYTQHRNRYTFVIQLKYLKRSYKIGD